MMSEFLVKFENSISAKFLMKWSLVQSAGPIFEQIRVLTHDEYIRMWLVELRFMFSLCSESNSIVHPG